MHVTGFAGVGGFCAYSETEATALHALDMGSRTLNGGPVSVCMLNHVLSELARCQTGSHVEVVRNNRK